MIRTDWLATCWASSKCIHGFDDQADANVNNNSNKKQQQQLQHPSSFPFIPSKPTSSLLLPFILKIFYQLISTFPNQTPLLSTRRHTPSNLDKKNNNKKKPPKMKKIPKKHQHDSQFNLFTTKLHFKFDWSCGGVDRRNEGKISISMYMDASNGRSRIFLNPRTNYNAVLFCSTYW